jgi:thioredoxin-like negative regulator of GroEL
MFGPTVDKVSMETGVMVYKIDVDNNKDLAIQQGISSVPTLIFERDGVVVHRHTGVMSFNQLRDAVNRY